MKDKLIKIKSDIQKIIDKMDNIDLIGPIPYLEESIENIEQAIEEWNLYHESEED